MRTLCTIFATYLEVLQHLKTCGGKENKTPQEHRKASGKEVVRLILLWTHGFICSVIHSSNKYLLPDAVGNADDRVVRKNRVRSLRRAGCRAWFRGSIC